MKKKKVKILKIGEKTLRQKSKEVPLEKIKTPRIQNVIKKLKKAISESKEALAIAAPQIGENWRIFVISDLAINPEQSQAKKFFVFINPKILKKSQKKLPCPEGCLSAPNLYGFVQRAEKIKIEAYDENGKKFIRGASGLLSQTIQHEMDHLEGILFLDKAFNISVIQNEN